MSRASSTRSSIEEVAMLDCEVVCVVVCVDGVEEGMDGADAFIGVLIENVFILETVP